MRILLIEDEPELVQVLKRGLEEDGHAVDVTHDGENGLELARMEPFDLIVLDVMLPKVDGYRVCRQLRSEGYNMPVLMLTARDAVDDRVRGLDAGADDYLVKPFAFKELLARVRALLRREAPSRDPVLRAADIQMDTVTHDVRRADKPVELTSKEYAILELFMRNPNRVLSRSQIAEHVWSLDFVSMSNLIDVYVGNLRRKLGDEHEPRLLVTVRGTGYQLRVPEHVTSH
jgi:DNA-binding response OmpR family regulator